MHIASLSFTNLGPFDEIEFEFDRHINVFVGPNNCGKSTALFALGDVAVYPFTVPKKLLHKSVSRFRARFGPRRRREDQVSGTFPIQCETKQWPKGLPQNNSIILHESILRFSLFGRMV